MHREGPQEFLESLGRVTASRDGSVLLMLMKTNFQVCSAEIKLSRAAKCLSKCCQDLAEHPATHPGICPGLGFGVNIAGPTSVLHSAPTPTPAVAHPSRHLCT